MNDEQSAFLDSILESTDARISQDVDMVFLNPLPAVAYAHNEIHSLKGAQRFTIGGTGRTRRWDMHSTKSKEEFYQDFSEAYKHYRNHGPANHLQGGRVKGFPLRRFASSLAARLGRLDPSVFEMRWLVDPELFHRVAMEYRMDIVSYKSTDGVLPLRLMLLENGLRGSYEDIIAGPDIDKFTMAYHIYIDDEARLAEKIATSKDKIQFMPSIFSNRGVQEAPNVIRVRDVNESYRMLLRKAEERRTVAQAAQRRRSFA